MCNINMCLHAYIVFYTGIKGFLGGSAVKKKKKNLPANTGDAGSIPGSGRWQPTPVFLPGKSHVRGGGWIATVE